jgi:putative spermidine/putrescine transport system ATP-binding protein
MAISDRVGVMEKGRIVQIAPPSELYERPATKFVAEFVGRVNLIARPEGGWLALRPEKLRLGEGTHRARVRECQYLGERRLVFLDGAFGPLTASIAGDVPVPGNGAEIAYGWAPDAGTVLTE